MPRRSKRLVMKSEQKKYQHYTGYPGGLRTEEYRKRLARKPEAIIEDAVLRMLPKNKLGRQMLSKLNVYRGDKHPHEAQKPQDWRWKCGRRRFLSESCKIEILRSA
jgi:ribosomal protein L13